MERLRVKTRFIVSAVLLGVIGLVVVSGCGGGGSSSSGSSSGSSETSSGGGSGELASAAEAACTSADKQIDALGTPQQEQVLGYLEKTEDLIEKLHEEMAAMGASGSAQEAYVEALGKSVIVLNHMTNAARSENFDAVRELSDELIELKVGKLAEAAELKACAEVPGASA
jgi:acyl-CoA reductase-like NAD-dependent aldehyde dehydrogenase